MYYNMVQMCKCLYHTAQISIKGVCSILNILRKQYKREHRFCYPDFQDMDNVSDLL